MKKITKVVLPVAGLGTRSLPASKNIPKEMLPVYNKPIIQHVVEEAVASGLSDVVFVTSREKKALEDHFDNNPVVEEALARAGKDKLLEAVLDVAQMVNVISIRQKEQKGLGHAVLCAENIINDEMFAVMVGDDMIVGQNPGIGQLIEVATKENMPVIGVMEVPAEKVNKYGIVAGNARPDGIIEVTGLVEKPNVGEAPSRMAIIGRYVLPPEIFYHLHSTNPGHGGEIQLTDALATLAAERGMLAVPIKGKRFDAGDWVEYLSASVYFALQEKTLQKDLARSMQAVLDEFAGKL